VRIVGVPPGRDTALPAHQLRTIQSLGIDWTDARAAPIDVDADLIIDGLIGTGVRLPLRPQEDRIIEAVNRVRALIVAIDVPSGLDADTGAGADRCVNASVTVTLGLPKPGLVGCKAAGRVFLADIGLPVDLFRDQEAAIRGIFALGDLVELV
jgi:hydroxyethylthiazole kinase-like uncharacterized protein yjeF